MKPTVCVLLGDASGVGAERFVEYASVPGI